MIRTVWHIADEMVAAVLIPLNSGHDPDLLVPPTDAANTGVLIPLNSGHDPDEKQSQFITVSWRLNPFEFRA